MSAVDARNAMVRLDVPYIARVMTHARLSQALLAAIVLEHFDGQKLTAEDVERSVGWAVLMAALVREAGGLAAVTGQAATAVHGVAFGEGMAQAAAIIKEVRPELAPVLRFPAMDVRRVIGEARLRQVLLDRYGQDAVLRFTQMLRVNMAMGMTVPVAAQASLAQLLGPNIEHLGWLVRRSVLIIRKTNYDTMRGAMIDTYRMNIWDTGAWRWRSKLDRFTCTACLALHGRVFPLSQDFDRAHLGCRCMPELLDSAQAPAGITGEQWLRHQNAETQDGILGKRGGELFRAGDVTLDDFLKVHRHVEYGSTWRSGGIAYAERRAARREARAKVT